MIGRRFAVGDIHGCGLTFRHLIEEVLQISTEDDVFLLGDYVNRGPNSKMVIDYILELREQGYHITTLKGNHEEMMLDAREDAQGLSFWKLVGGVETMESFEVNHPDDIPERYFYFLERLIPYIELTDYYLVHAGFNFSAPDPLRDTHSMLWQKQYTVDKAWLGNRKLVQGHVPTALETIKRQADDPATVKFVLDAGCVYWDRPGMGYLAAMDLDTRQIFHTHNRDFYKA